MQIIAISTIFALASAQGLGGLNAVSPIINGAGFAKVLQPEQPGSILTAQSVINILGPPGCAEPGYALGIHRSFNVSNIISTCLCVEVLNPASGQFVCPACPINSQPECKVSGDPCGCVCSVGFYADASGACIKEPFCEYPMVAAKGSSGDPICLCQTGFLPSNSQLGPACVIIGVIPTSAIEVTSTVEATPEPTAEPTPVSSVEATSTVEQVTSSAAVAAPCASLGRRSRSRRAAGVKAILVNNGTFTGGFACPYGNVGPIAAEGSVYVELTPTATAVVIPHLKICSVTQSACFSADGSIFCVNGQCP